MDNGVSYSYPAKYSSSLPYGAAQLNIHIIRNDLLDPLILKQSMKAIQLH